jgi:hypothetical protein
LLGSAHGRLREREEGGGSWGNHGVPPHKSRYREWLPVVEIDGARAFVYYVDADRLLHKLASK